MVDRYKARLWLESLEDRTLPSSSPIVLSLGGLEVGNQPSVSWSAEATQPDGKVLTVGAVSSSSGSSVNVLARFNSNGTLDAGFGTRGEVLTSIQAGAGEASGLSVQPGGTILLAVDLSGATSITVARFNPDGSPDDSFAPGGTASLPLVPASGDSSTLVAEGNGVIVTVDANGVHIQSYAPSVAPSLTPTFNASVCGSFCDSVSDQLSGYPMDFAGQFAGGSSSSMSASGSGYVHNVVAPSGYLTTQAPWYQPSNPLPPGGVSSPVFHSFVAASPAVDSSQGNSGPTWISPAPVAQGPPVLAVTLDLRPSGADFSPLSQDSAAYLVILISSVGSDNPQSGVDFASNIQSRTSLQTPSNASAGLPSYLDAGQVVPAASSVVPPPPSAPPLVAPAAKPAPASVVELPAYLVPPGSEALASSSLSEADPREQSPSNEARDDGLAAVDAAFALADRREKQTGSADDLAGRVTLPTNSGEQESPRLRDISWQLWFALFVVASGGGAAWQGNGRVVGLAGDRPRSDDRTESR